MMGIFAVLLLAALWEDVSVQHPKFCADQPESIRGQVGGSVTIPCRFSFPIKYKDDEVSVYWRAGHGDRCGSSSFIYNQTSEYVHNNYTARISLVKDPNWKGTGSIRIDRLQNSDSERKYCCRIDLKLKNNTVIGWQNRHMTKLVLAGGPPQSHVYQLDAIPALKGGSVTIPCRYIDPEQREALHFNVNWTAGSEDLCLNFNEYIHPNYTNRIKQITYPGGSNTSSLQIEGLQESDSKRYCCSVRITTSGKEQLINSSHGTELIIGDLSPIQGFSVMQLEEITAQKGEPVTMKCTYNYPEDSNLLWIGVFWRYQDDWEKYVYSPNNETIHPDYRGRTRLIGDPMHNGTVSLQIDNVTEKDRQTYYCLVVFRFCNGSNAFDSKIQQGKGSRLTLQGPASNTYFVIAAIIALFVVVIMIVILILKKKGCICKGAKPVESYPAPRAGVQLETLGATPKVSPEPEVNKRPKVVEDSVLYAALDLTNPSRAKPGVKPDLPNETIYSAVKPK